MLNIFENTYQIDALYANVKTGCLKHINVCKLNSIHLYSNLFNLKTHYYKNSLEKFLQ